MASTGIEFGRSAPVQQFVYQGRLSEIYRIFIINLLLGLITLTIYRFWGKTNMRRYIWSSMSVQGEPFEYTGTGGELFKGFLIVVGLYLLFYLALVVASLAIGEATDVLAQFLLVLVIVYIVFVAQYAAQRYRLTRTTWRGIRGGMTGSAWSYGLKAVAFQVLNLVTLTLSAPWTQMRLLEDRFNNSYFGDGQTTLSARAGPLLPTYLLGILISILGMGGLVAVIVVLMQAVGALNVGQEIFNAEAEGRLPDVSAPEAQVFIVYLFIAVLVFYAGIAFISGIAFAPYAAAFFRELAGNLRFTGLKFQSRVGAGNFMALWVGNIAWVVFTFGLGLPVAIHRSLKFFAQRLEIHGMIDADRLRQSTLQRPKTGEGLLEVFDPGFL